MKRYPKSEIERRRKNLDAVRRYQLAHPDRVKTHRRNWELKNRDKRRAPFSSFLGRGA